MNSSSRASEIAESSDQVEVQFNGPGKVATSKILQTYPIPSTLNSAIVLLQLSLVASAFFMLARVDGVAQLLLLAFYFGLVMNAVYSTIHEAHHRILFKNRRLNDAVGVSLSLFFPAPFHLLRQGHIGHHRRNRSDDEAFDLYFDRDKRWWKYLAWYGILTGVYWVVVVLANLILLFLPKLFDPKIWRWDRTAAVFLEHFSPESFLVMRLEALAAVLLQATLFWLVDVPWSYYVTMYFGFGLMWSSLQYVHHYQAERDVLDGAKNLHLNKPVDLFWMNHNLHQTHHQLPTVPWCYLPKVAELKRTKTSQLLGAYFQMWRGPKHAEEHVVNKFQGEVSR